MAPDFADRLAEAARLQERWQFAAARDVLTALLAGADRPADRLAVVTARRMLAEVLRELGETEEAYALAQPLADECVARLGAGHPATARALTVLATVAQARGDLAAAEELYRRVLDGRFRESGPAGRAVRLARAYLALLHRDRAAEGTEADPDRGGDARAEAARAALEAAYKGLRRAYGITDPDTIRFAVELARTARRAGDDAVARRLLTVARAGCQARLDPWHPLAALIRRESAEFEPAEPASPEPPAEPAPAMPPAEPAPPEPVAISSEPVVVAVPPAPVAVPPLPVAVPPLPVSAAPEGGRRPRRTRRWLLVLVAVVVVVVAAVATAIAVAIGDGGESARRPADRSAPARPAPTGHEPLPVDVRDEGTRLVVGWPDPAPAPVVVAVARDGAPAAVVTTLPAGSRGYVLAGTDPRAEYCVIVGAVYPGEATSATTTTCTTRAARSR
ncbi:tetratricopeptide repeat protein [Planosporangium sp. 12N6]|uniref:tetratricopeptide repeat protein n=1 Tax=Planosporangium spinosum TaxID=3402278 RepID=UPI003CF73B5F